MFYLNTVLVLRGEGWYYSRPFHSLTDRDRGNPVTCYGSDLGFRLILTRRKHV